MLVGAGRRTDVIDPAAGVELIAKTGDYVDKGQPLAGVLGSSEEKCRRALRRLKRAVGIGDAVPAPAGAVVREIAG